MKKAVIIIPTYNERGNIERAIEALLAVFQSISHWDMHILVVDDSSPDGTSDIVKALSKKQHRVHLVINKQKAGLGSAYLKGMDYAFDEMAADVVFEFDADLSHDPTKIPLFIDKLDEGYDIVLGSRYIPGGGIPDDWGLHRKFLSVVGNLVIMLVFTNFRIRDWTGGYRAFTKEVYKAIETEMRSNTFTGYSFQIGFLHKAVRRNFKIVEVPFKFVDRTLGSSKLGPEYVKNNLIYIFKVRYEEIVNHRVFRFAVVGGIGALIQLTGLSLLRQLINDTDLLLTIPLGFANYEFTGYLLSFLLSIEVAIISNFFINNFWTFSDRKLELSQMPAKFLTFNVASSGSLLIQFVIGNVGEKLVGIHDILRLPFYTLDTGLLYAVLGILIGMFWNFFAYSTFIWKHKPTP